MHASISSAPITSLRQRLIDDMNMRRFSRETQRNYIRDVGRFASFLRRPPDTATADDLRRFQVEQRNAGVPVPTMNSIVSDRAGEANVLSTATVIPAAWVRAAMAAMSSTALSGRALRTFDHPTSLK